MILPHPDYTPPPDGEPCCGIVFEADWDSERIWYLVPGANGPVMLIPEHTNDNSPCVLPDRRIVSLWLNRPASEGYHEINVMNANQPTDHHMALMDADEHDMGIGCSGS